MMSSVVYPMKTGGLRTMPTRCAGSVCSYCLSGGHVTLQVREMLPGGLSVVGLCLVSPAFELTTAASLTKLASRFSKPYFESAWSAFLTMHFSTITGR